MSTPGSAAALDVKEFYGTKTSPVGEPVTSRGDTKESKESQERQLGKKPPRRIDSWDESMSFDFKDEDIELGENFKFPDGFKINIQNGNLTIKGDILGNGVQINVSNGNLKMRKVLGKNAKIVLTRNPEIHLKHNGKEFVADYALDTGKGSLMLKGSHPSIKQFTALGGHWSVTFDGYTAVPNDLYEREGNFFIFEDEKFKIPVYSSAPATKGHCEALGIHSTTNIIAEGNVIIDGRPMRVLTPHDRGITKDDKKNKLSEEATYEAYRIYDMLLENYGRTSDIEHEYYDNIHLFTTVLDVTGANFEMGDGWGGAHKVLLIDCAAKFGSVNYLNALLDDGADVNHFDGDHTPLYHALEECNYDCATLLLKKGAHYNFTGAHDGKLFRANAAEQGPETNNRYSAFLAAHEGLGFRELDISLAQILSDGGWNYKTFNTMPPSHLIHMFRCYGGSFALNRDDQQYAKFEEVVQQTILNFLKDVEARKTETKKQQESFSSLSLTGSKFDSSRETKRAKEKSELKQQIEAEFRKRFNENAINALIHSKTALNKPFRSTHPENLTPCKWFFDKIGFDYKELEHEASEHDGATAEHKSAALEHVGVTSDHDCATAESDQDDAAAHDRATSAHDYDWATSTHDDATAEHDGATVQYDDAASEHDGAESEHDVAPIVYDVEAEREASEVIKQGEKFTKSYIENHVDGILVAACSRMYNALLDKKTPEGNAFTAACSRILDPLLNKKEPEDHHLFSELVKASGPDFRRFVSTWERGWLGTQLLQTVISLRFFDYLDILLEHGVNVNQYDQRHEDFWSGCNYGGGHDQRPLEYALCCGQIETAHKLMAAGASSQFFAENDYYCAKKVRSHALTLGFNAELNAFLAKYNIDFGPATEEYVFLNCTIGKEFRTKHPLTLMDLFEEVPYDSTKQNVKKDNTKEQKVESEALSLTSQPVEIGHVFYRKKGNRPLAEPISISFLPHFNREKTGVKDLINVRIEIGGPKDKWVSYPKFPKSNREISRYDLSRFDDGHYDYVDDSDTDKDQEDDVHYDSGKGDLKGKKEATRQYDVYSDNSDSDSGKRDVKGKKEAARHYDTYHNDSDSDNDSNHDSGKGDVKRKKEATRQYDAYYDRDQKDIKDKKEAKERKKKNEQTRYWDRSSDEGSKSWQTPLPLSHYASQSPLSPKALEFIKSVSAKETTETKISLEDNIINELYDSVFNSENSGESNVKVFVKLLDITGPDYCAQTTGLSLIARAAKNGHLECIRILIDKGANLLPNTTGSLKNHFPPLAWALINEHFDCAEAILNVGSKALAFLTDSAASKISDKIPLLSEALFPELASFLSRFIDNLRHKKDKGWSLLSEDDETLLLLAEESDNGDKIKFASFLFAEPQHETYQDYFAKPQHQQHRSYQQDYLHYSLAQKWVKIATKMNDLMHEIYAINAEYDRVFDHNNTDPGKEKDFIQLVDKTGPDFDSCGTLPSLLMRAASGGHLEYIKILIKRGAYLLPKNTELGEHSIFFLALKNQHFECAEALFFANTDDHLVNFTSNVRKNIKSLIGKLCQNEFLSVFSDNLQRDDNYWSFGDTKRMGEVKILAEHAESSSATSQAPEKTTDTNKTIELSSLMAPEKYQNKTLEEQWILFAKLISNLVHQKMQNKILKFIKSLDSKETAEADRMLDAQFVNELYCWVFDTKNLDKNKEKVFSKLLDKTGPDYRLEKEGDNLVTLAARGGHLEYIKILIKRGASLSHDHHYHRLETPFYAALKNKHFDCAEELVRANIDEFLSYWRSHEITRLIFDVKNNHDFLRSFCSNFRFPTNWSFDDRKSLGETKILAEMAESSLGTSQVSEKTTTTDKTLASSSPVAQQEKYKNKTLEEQWTLFAQLVNDLMYHKTQKAVLHFIEKVRSNKTTETKEKLEEIVINELYYSLFDTKNLDDNKERVFSKLIEITGPDYRIKHRESLIRRAAHEGHLGYTKILIKSKANLLPKLDWPTEHSPLYIALDNKHFDCAEELVRANTDSPLGNLTDHERGEIQRLIRKLQSKDVLLQSFYRNVAFLDEGWLFDHRKNLGETKTLAEQAETSIGTSQGPEKNTDKTLVFSSSVAQQEKYKNKTFEEQWIQFAELVDGIIYQNRQKKLELDKVQSQVKKM